MSRPRAHALLLIAVLVVTLAACSSSDDPAPAEESLDLGETTVEPAPGEEGAEADTGEEGDEAGPDEPLRTATVEVYFPSASRDGLVGEFRQIFATATPGDRVKQIIADLISGPTSKQCLRAVSPSTRLRQAYVLENGTAYLDFSAELTQGIGGGSTKEMLTVYSIVNSVAFGAREVNRVAILVNGRPLETMNGHLDLRRPLKPNSRLILGSIVVDADLSGVATTIAD